MSESTCQRLPEGQANTTQTAAHGHRRQQAAAAHCSMVQCAKLPERVAPLASPAAACTAIALPRPDLTLPRNSNCTKQVTPGAEGPKGFERRAPLHIRGAV